MDTSRAARRPPPGASRSPARASSGRGVLGPTGPVALTGDTRGVLRRLLGAPATARAALLAAEVLAPPLALRGGSDPLRRG